MYDKYPWLGWGIVAVIEAVALGIAVALWHFGHLAWYLVPLSLLVPPFLAAVALLLGLLSAESSGQNPFQ